MSTSSILAENRRHPSRLFMIVCMFCTIIKFAKLSNEKLISNHTPKILDAKMDNENYVTTSCYDLYINHI